MRYFRMTLNSQKQYALLIYNTLMSDAILQTDHFKRIFAKFKIYNRTELYEQLKFTTFVL